MEGRKEREGFLLLLHDFILCDYYRPEHILPVLIPFMYLVTVGVGKICALAEVLSVRVGKWICLGVMGYVTAAFGYSLFIRFLPYYLQGENMFSMWGKGFVP